MKKLFLLLFLLQASFSFSQENKAEISKESLPIFPGCEEEVEVMKCFNAKVKEHIRENFSKPKERIKGRSVVTYEIEADGTVKVIESEGENAILNEEAKRIIELLPKMTPAYQKGKATRILMTVPITF